MNTKDIYVRFLTLLQTLQAKEFSEQLDTTAEKLLEVITVQYGKSQTLTVTECMELSSIASPATIHRKLDDLRIHGWIDFVYEGDNRRTKYLVPSAKANKYFEKISKLMSKVLAN
jgi:protein-disulfide isomerase-like protein with CxxC motif